MESITPSDLRDQYDHTDLARQGYTFEQAVSSPLLRKGLEAGIKARRRMEALRAQAAAIPHQIQEAA